MSKPMIQKLDNCSEFRVVDLRNPNGEGWNTTLLARYFNEEEIELISRVNLSAFGTRDKLIWKHARYG